MAAYANVFCDKIQDKINDNNDGVEPLVLIPPSISTVDISDLPDENNSFKKSTWLTRFEGIIYSLLSSFIFTCATFFIKEMNIDLLDVLLLRMVAQVLITGGYALHKHYPLFAGTLEQTFWQICCCAGNSISFFSFFAAMYYVELSDVTTLSYTKVVWIIILNTFIYRERPSLSMWIAMGLTFVGVIFVTQPSFIFPSTIKLIVIDNNAYRLLGFTLSIISGLTIAIHVLSFKNLISSSKDIKSSVLNFHFSLCVCVCLIIYQVYRTFVLHNGLSLKYILTWKYILGSSICLIIIFVNVLQQKAIKHEHPAIFTILGSSDIIFSLILQNIFSTKHSNIIALIGSFLVIVSVVIIGISKIMKNNDQERK